MTTTAGRFACLVASFALGEWPTRLRVLEGHRLAGVSMFIMLTVLAMILLLCIGDLVTRAGR
jgi:hypothetical protein